MSSYKLLSNYFINDIEDLYGLVNGRIYSFSSVLERHSRIANSLSRDIL